MVNGISQAHSLRSRSPPAPPHFATIILNQVGPVIMSCAKYQYGNHETSIARIVQACLKFPILSLDTQLVLPQSNSTLVLTTSRPTLCLANMRPELLTSLRAVVRPAGADPSSHCPLIVCCLTPREPLDIDHRSCVQDTAFFL